jgi:hypothetical protein
MRPVLTILAVGLAGLVGAASMGYAAYVVSRDTVGTPVTKLKVSRDDLAPAPVSRRPARTTATVTEPAPPPPPPPPPPPATTTGEDESGDDSSGRGRGRGRGGDDNSGKGGGDDDDD